jgi:hypothetical protein
MVALEIPSGLEGWTLDRLRAQGFTARYMFGTAGGGLDSRARLDPKILFDRQPTPANLRDANASAVCKLRTRLSQYFEDVSTFHPCPTNMEPNELCWRMWLGGHTSNSRGFNGSEFRMIGPKYWVSAKVDLWIGLFTNYDPGSGDNLGWRMKLIVATLSSAYARFPASARPTGNDYQPISYYEPRVDADALDAETASRVADILAVGNPLTCSNPN